MENDDVMKMKYVFLTPPASMYCVDHGSHGSLFPGKVLILKHGRPGPGKVLTFEYFR